jgi:hypothetical protein
VRGKSKGSKENGTNVWTVMASTNCPSHGQVHCAGSRLSPLRADRMRGHLEQGPEETAATGATAALPTLTLAGRPNPPIKTKTFGAPW